MRQTNVTNGEIAKYQTDTKHLENDIVFGALSTIKRSENVKSEIKPVMNNILNK